jgi:hypothetical protein
LACIRPILERSFPIAAQLHSRTNPRGKP